MMYWLEKGRFQSPFIVFEPCKLYYSTCARECQLTFMNTDGIPPIILLRRTNIAFVGSDNVTARIIDFLPNPQLHIFCPKQPS